MGRFGRLLGYVRPYWAIFAASSAAAIVASTLDGFSFALLIPFLRALFGIDGAGHVTGVEKVLNHVVGWFFAPVAGRAALRGIVIVMLVSVVIKNVAAYFAAYLGVRLQETLVRDLRLALYGHIQKLGLAFYQRTRGGQLITRMLADADQAKSVVSAALTSVFQNAVLIMVYIAILFSLSWRLTLLALLAAPAIALLLRPIMVRVRTRLKQVLEERGEMTAIMTETVEGARLVKAHGAEGYERRRFTEALRRYLVGMMGTQRYAILSSPLSEILGTGVIVLLLLVGTGGNAGAMQLRPEMFVAFLAVTLRLLPPVKSLSQFPANAEQSLAAADRLFEVLDHPPDDLDSPAAKPVPPFAGDIVFDDVWFAYEAQDWVLREVRFRIRKGEVVALVGPSGAGKSTAVDLLPRFIDPTRGVVRLDGVATTDYSRRSLRRSIGVVSQHTVLFNDTVRANIAYGDEATASVEAVEAAARAANAHDFIERLPRGYHTVLGERGTRLSGGERQRIAIARALLRDPPILILDEATSALDNESERLVQEAIQRLLENRTVLVIAHRLSTVARADRIVVLDRGRVVEQGSHADLVRAGGLYQRLHALELSAAVP